MSYFQNLIQFLPSFLRSNTNFVSLIGGIGNLLDDFSANIDSFRTYNDWLTCPEEQLDSFVAQYGIVFPPAMPLESKRNLARDIISFNRANGTLRALQYCFSVIGLQVQILHAWVLEGWIKTQTSNYSYVFGDQSQLGKQYVDYITVSNQGTGYSTASVAFSGGGGSGAAANAYIVSGAVVAIEVTAPGAGYTSVPTVIVSGDGSDAAGVATLSGTQREDGTVTFSNGVYLFGTDQFGNYYAKVPIKLENYPSNQSFAPLSPVFIASFGTLTYTATTISRSTGDFVTDGFLEGNQILITNSGIPANNGVWTISDVGSSVLTVVEGTLTSGTSTTESIQTYQVAIKTPYLYINISSINYNDLTSTYTDPVTGIVYPFTASDKYVLTQQILAYFTQVVRPANVVFLTIATPFTLTDVVPYAASDEGVILTYENAGMLYNGSIAYGNDVNIVDFNNIFGGFEYGNTQMALDVPEAVNAALTYTNATGKTYFDETGILQTAAPNVWPTEYDESGNYLGKGVWQGTTNLLEYSTDFSNAVGSAWSAENSPTLTPGESSPDVTGTNAVEIITTNASTQGVYQPVTVTGDTTPYTHSVWLRGAVGGEVVEIGSDEIGLTNGTTTVTLTLEWARYSWTFANASLTTLDAVIYSLSTAQTFYAFGSQLENLAAATPYVPTTSAPVTRDDDIVGVASSVVGLDVANANVSIIATGTTGPGIIGGEAASILLDSDGSDAPFLFYTLPGALDTNNGGDLETANQQAVLSPYMAAVAFSGAGRWVCLNGGTVATDTGTLVGDETINYIGGSGPSLYDDCFNGWISSLIVYPYTMTPAQLQAFTTNEIGILPGAISLLAPGAPVVTVVKTYNAGIAALQFYEPLRPNNHVTMVLPVGCRAQFLVSGLDRVSMAKNQIVYRTYPTIANFNNFKYTTLSTLTGKSMSANGGLTYTSSTITRGSGSWLTDGFLIGDQIIVVSTDIPQNNNVVGIITNIDALEIIVSGAPYMAGTSSTDTITNCYDADVNYYFSCAMNVLTPQTGDGTLTLVLE